MNIDNAIAAHTEWKIRLRQAIATDATVDARSIGADNCCDLGRWLHGEAKTTRIAPEVLNACVTRHADFHREAGRVASAINAKQMAQAEGMLAAGGAYANASTAVGVALNQLKRALQAA